VGQVGSTEVDGSSRVAFVDFSRIAWRTLSAVSGSLNNRTPIASNTAFAITAPAVVMAGSPPPWGARSSRLTSDPAPCGFLAKRPGYLEEGMARTGSEQLSA
jgi:hypothetical protein